MRPRTIAAALLAGLALLLAAAAAFPWSFGVCGDSRDDLNGIFPRILSAVEGSGMEFLLHTGDLEPAGGEKAWAAFRKRTSGFRKPLRVVIGNHELPGATRERFARFFGLPGTSYSFAHRDARIAVVDNAGGSLPPATLDWLDRELASHPKGKDGIAHLVVAMHIPPRTETFVPHGTKPGYAEQSAKLLAILKRRGVELILCGHEHMHAVEEWDGITMIVSGGGGAPLYPLQRFGFYEIEVGPGRIGWKFHPISPAGAAPPAR